MNRSRKRDDGALDSFFRSVYESLAKKVLEEEAGIGPKGGEIRQTRDRTAGKTSAVAASPSSAKRPRDTQASKGESEAADPTYH